MQEEIRLDQIAPCRSCHLQFESVYRLEDIANQIVDRNACATYGDASKRFVLIPGPQAIALYDSTGISSQSNDVAQDLASSS